VINQGSSSVVRTRSAAEAAIHNLESWWRHNVIGHWEGAPKRAWDNVAPWRSWYPWVGDARFHLGRARRALDHGDVGQAEREAHRALELDNVSPWALIVLGRCALAQNRPRKAVQALSRAYHRAPSNRYIIDLLAKAESAANADEG
jgi:predicted Zn-dependent protease